MLVPRSLSYVFYEFVSWLVTIATVLLNCFGKWLVLLLEFFLFVSFRQHIFQCTQMFHALQGAMEVIFHDKEHLSSVKHIYLYVCVFIYIIICICV